MTQPRGRIGQNVAALRKARGLTTRALSDRLAELGHRIPQSSLSKIEAGTAGVDAEDLLAIALALGTTPNRLLLSDRVAADSVALTPEVATSGHRAWAWADGVTPLEEAHPFGETTAEKLDDFRRHARPVDQRLVRSAPPYQAVQDLLIRVEEALHLVAADAGGAQPETLRRALTRAEREVLDLLAEVAPSAA
jgi:transcriptional regulator with XRE-family HTH domain